MRHSLKAIAGDWRWFFAEVGKISHAKMTPEKKTVLLVDVRTEEGDAFAQHVWVPRDPPLHDVKTGDKIKFRARILPYKKHSAENGTYRLVGDYGLAHVCHVEKVGEVPRVVRMKKEEALAAAGIPTEQWERTPGSAFPDWMRELMMQEREE